MSKRWPIDSKMLTGFAGMVLLIVVIGLLGIQQIQSLSEVVAQLAEVEIPMQNAVLEMKFNNAKYAMGIRSYIFWRMAKSASPNVVGDKLNLIRQASRDFDLDLGYYASRARVGRPQEWVQTVRLFENDLRQVGENIIGMADSMKDLATADRRSSEHTLNTLLLDFENRLFSLDALLNEPIQKFNSPQLARQLVSVEVGRRRAVTFMAWAMVIVVGLGTQTAFLIYRRSKRERQHREYLWRKVIMLEEQERNHLALQVHDQMGQDLSALKIYLGLLEKELPQGGSSESKERIAKAKDILDQLMKKTHNISELLRPPELDEVGLVQSIAGLVVHNREVTGALYNFSSPAEEVKLAPEESLVLYRVVQEGLTNIAKYSQAKNVDVVLRHDRRNFTVVITDDGVGFSTQTIGHRPARRKDDKMKMGLQGLKERMELLGGHLEIVSKPGTGTRLEAILPIS